MRAPGYRLRSDRTWVVVASREGAKIFQSARLGDSLWLERSLEHPRGRAHARAVESDRQGRVFSGGAVKMRHALSGEESPQVHEAHVFARIILREIEEGRDQNRFDVLVVFAEPHFLGILKSYFKGPLLERLRAAFPKNRLGSTAAQLRDEIRETVLVAA